MKLGKILFLFTIVLLVVCSSDIDVNMSETMADFEFTTQDEETLNLEDLKGEWWITNLVFTNCTTICPRTTTNLTDVH